MRKKENNYAFIDSQNLNLGIQKLGWKLDYRKFRVYLAEKYGVNTEHCSTLLKHVAEGKIWFMNNLRRLLEYKRKTPPRDGTRGSVFR